MSKLVWIKCKQIVEYNQQHIVTDEEYELLKDLDYQDIDEDDDRKIYRIVDGYLDGTDIYDWEHEYKDVTIELGQAEES